MEWNFYRLKKTIQKQEIVTSLTSLTNPVVYSTSLTSASYLHIHALFRPSSILVTLLLLSHFLLILFNETIFAEVHFSTQLNDDSDTPNFRKGATFVFKYQAVTSESESKVHVFSPFRRLLEINLKEAYSLVVHRGHSDTLAGMNLVRRCQTGASKNAYELLFNRIDEQLILSDKKFPKNTKLKMPS